MRRTDNTTIDQIASESHETHDTDCSEEALDRAPGRGVMNEKRGILFFPDSKGESDMYYAFISDDPDFHEWCVDYFDYTWNKAGTYEVSKIREI